MTVSENTWNAFSALQRNPELLGPITYTAAEDAFARKIQVAVGIEPTGLRGTPKALEETKGDLSGGSTMWATSAGLSRKHHFGSPRFPRRHPGNSWVVTACGGMSIGHKGMLYAAKALGMTMVDLYERDDLRTEMRRGFLERKGKAVDKAVIPDGLPRAPGMGDSEE